MPIHDWSRVNAGLFHDFHQAWMGELRSALNREVLPKQFYALIEQYAGKVEVDILTLHSSGKPPRVRDDGDPFAGTATVVETPPEVDVIERAAHGYYAFKQSSVVIREVHNDRVVALIEVISHGNKSGEFALERFVDKIGNALMAGIHVVIIDLHPPGKWDPQGMHDVIWQAIGESGYDFPPGKSLTLASYTGTPALTAYMKPAAVGERLAPLPLFLDADHYVRLPLEETYQSAYDGVPETWREVIEGREQR